ncbi:MAG: hypothetical protein HOE90_09265 [Bacteriovoracaceae bacterium]|nr:hypothetical protein [Bacteriovoracaceae bacterium]
MIKTSLLLLLSISNLYADVATKEGFFKYTNTTYSSQKKHFAFTYTGYGCSSVPNTLCVYGKYKRGTPLILLNKEHNSFCRAVTGGAFKFKDQFSNFRATKLEKIHGCENPSSYFVAFVGLDDVRFKNIKLSRFKGSGLRKLHKKIQAENQLNKLFSKSVTVKKEIEGNKIPYHTGDFSRLRPVGLYSKEIDEIKFIQYQLTEKVRKIDYIDGPLFVYLKKPKAVYNLGDVCNRKFNTFVLDGQIFFYNQTYCCECGYVRSELFNFTDGEFSSVLKNNNWSDRKLY